MNTNWREINGANEVQRNMISLLTEYSHKASLNGTSEIMATWFRNKKDLIEMFSKHPNYDAENFRIVFDTDYERAFDSSAINEFRYFIEGLYEKEIFAPNEAKIYGRTYREWQDDYNAICKRYEAAKRAYERKIIDAKEFFEYKLEYHDFECQRYYIYRIVGDYYDSQRALEKKQFIEFNLMWLPKEIIVAYKRLRELIDHLSYTETSIINVETADRAKEMFPAIRIGAGSTISKLLRRVLSLPEFKALNEWSTTETIEWLNPLTGELQQRTKVITLESKLSELADKISPLKIKRHTLISLNPLDYLTMSFGHKWASCHTIDKNNYRNCANSYHGEYCSGTLSYMLDESSIIFYTVDSGYEGNEYETQDKMQRCVFCLSKDGNTLLQSRVYPDGRDGGDRSLASQFRTIMQQVISDCMDAPNHWIVKKGECVCGEYTESDGTHYRDYVEYNDGNISIRYNCEPSVIKIGHNPIDPYSGEVHYEHSVLNYGNYHCCAHCNEEIDIERDSCIYCEDNDSYYCDDDCAEREGVHYCLGDTYGNGYHTESNCFRDAYTEEWFYGEPAVTTEDGNEFASDDNAYNAGYDHDEDGYWYPEDQIFTDAYDRDRYHENNMEVDIDCDHQYSSVSNAEADGCICINGKWYVSAEDAEADGLHYVEEEDKWMNDEEYSAYGEQMAEEQIEAETNNNSEESEVA